MERDVAIHGRLMRWGSWLVTGGVGKSEGVSSVYLLRERVVGASDNLWSPRVPFDAIEARATDAAVREIDEGLRKVLGVVYVSHMGHGRERQAARVGCCVKTLHTRLCQADLALRHVFDRDADVRVREEAAADRRQFRGLPEQA